ncbi:hypothetical protein [Streptomyces sp. NPDC018031]|uniref:hypothetical protein n=1 Tax=Streptomyces sp. NPDC018031 TaxID=3365033 RepID=UPI003788F264
MAGTETSRTRDSDPAAALDYGLSQRALIAVSSRSSDVAELIHPPPHHARPQRPPDPRRGHGARRVRQAVRYIRTAPPPPPADPPADPAVAALRAVVDDLAASPHAIGELMLEVAAAYLFDIEAADVLALLCDQIGEPSNTASPPLRYAMSGDRRALTAPSCRPPIPPAPVRLTARFLRWAPCV